MSIRDVAVLAIGFGLDAALGDPERWPHPVRLIGKQIEFEEGLVRSYILPEARQDAWPLDMAQTEQLAGAALVADVMLAGPLATWAIVKLSSRLHPAFGLIVESFLFYQLLAARSLQDASMRVHDALEQGDLPSARDAVAQIVGRDTDVLDEQGVIRATVETVAENTSDGVIAPIVYQALGGAPATMLYKAVNTLDSMIGYKNERYLHFGRAAAKADDAFNIVPARVAGTLMCVAARLVDLDPQAAWRIFKRDRYNHASPNSAHCEAACAGALGIELGGASSYFGKRVDKPAIGDGKRAAEPADIVRANRLMRVTALLGLALGAVLALARPRR